METTYLVTQKMSIEGKEMEFSLARSLAGSLASSSISEPMLIVWNDGKKVRSIRRYQSVRTSRDGSRMLKGTEVVFVSM